MGLLRGGIRAENLLKASKIHLKKGSVKVPKNLVSLVQTIKHVQNMNLTPLSKTILIFI